MKYIFIFALLCLLCYVMGYIVGINVTEDKINKTRKEMGLDEPDECYGCKEIGLPCDPNCKYRKELMSNGIIEKNDSEKN